MYLETEVGRKMYSIRITSYSAYFADALRFPGRGVLRDDGSGVLRWQFPSEGMTKQRRSPWEEHGKIGRKAWFLSLLVGCVLCACGWLGCLWGSIFLTPGVFLCAICLTPKER